MSKRQGRILLISQQKGLDTEERIIWKDLAYDEIVALPLTWRLWRADCQFLACNSDEPELSSTLRRQLEAAVPYVLRMYLLHKQCMYQLSLGPVDVAASLRNGRAVVQAYAEPLKSAGGNDGTVIGLNSCGVLVNMEPSEAASVFKGGDLEREGGVVIDSHPIVMSRKSVASLSGEIDPPPSIIARTVEQMSRLTLPTKTKKDPTAEHDRRPRGDEKADGNVSDSEDDADMNVANNPLVQLLMGSSMQPQAPALLVTLQVKLFPLDPATLRALIEWQQKIGILPPSKLLTAWKLSSFSGSAVFHAFMRVLSLPLVLAAFSAWYKYNESLRCAADRFTASVYEKMPAAWQAVGASSWHALVSNWMLWEAAPGFFSAVSIVIMLCMVFMAVLARYFIVFAVSLGMPMAHHPGVYGLEVTGCEALSEKEWKNVQADAKERPNLARGISNSDWITEDIQERYWASSAHNSRKARAALESTSKWRQDKGIDSILKSPQPHFHTIKRAFPHGILARSKDGCIVFVMKLGVLHKQYGILEEAGIGNNDLVRHLAFVYEHMFRVVDSGTLPRGRIVNLLDMDGIGIMDVQGKAFKLGNMASKISEHHYPDRLHRALLINCPGMVNQMWAVVKNMLDRNARDRTSLYTKGDSLTGLREIMEDEDIPQEWGGKRHAGFYHHSDEADLFKLVAENNGCQLHELAIQGMFEPSPQENE